MQVFSLNEIYFINPKITTEYLTGHLLKQQEKVKDCVFHKYLMPT